MNKLKKIYNDLPLEERAALVFSAQAEGNEKIGNEIMRTVPYKTYKQRDRKFVDRIQSLERIALIWGLEYWRTLAMSTSRFYSTVDALRNSNLEKFKYYRELKIKENISKLALELVLDNLEEEFGVKKQLVLELTGTVDCCGEIDRLNEQPDDVLERRDEYLKFFLSNIS